MEGARVESTLNRSPISPCCPGETPTGRRRMLGLQNSASKTTRLTWRSSGASIVARGARRSSRRRGRMEARRCQPPVVGKVEDVVPEVGPGPPGQGRSARRHRRRRARINAEQRRRDRWQHRLEPGDVLEEVRGTTMSCIPPPPRRARRRRRG